MARRVELIFCLLIGSVVGSAQPLAVERIGIRADAPGKPFPHFWEQMFGSGRAGLSLRESYRRDLTATKKATGFSYVRFHAIFHDELGVYDEDAQGNPVYNFSYVDQIYDGLLERNVRPFVELSFIPRKLSATDRLHPFWYKPFPNPPKDYDRWAELVFRFTQHLIQRYGIDEVSQWYFEVWNEPNIDFWSGEPKEETYFRLYDSAAAAVKKADRRLRVGGPSTAQAAWVDRFIDHCAKRHVPVDFASTHVYGNESAKDVFGTNERIPQSDMVARAARKVFDQVKASAMPTLPILFTEYNATYLNDVQVTDSTYMGPWLANNIRLCDGLVTTMAYWAFSDVFEEQGVVKKPFYGGYGLIAVDGIPKPAFNAFAMLHDLGTERIALRSDSIIATRRADKSLVLAVWNYAPANQIGTSRQVEVTIEHISQFHHARVRLLDQDHGSALTAWQAMGRPDFPSREQQQQLRAAGQLPPAEVRPFSGSVSLTLPAHSLALVEVIP